MKFNSVGLFLLLCILLFSGAVFSQNATIDSLETELSIHTERDTARADLLYDLAFSNFQRDVELTKSYLGKAEDLNNALNYIRGKARVLYLKGILESRKSNYPESLSYFKQSLRHYESIRDKKGIAVIYTAFGITHFSQSEYEEALKCYEKSADLHKDLGNKRGIATALLNAGNVNSEIGNYDEAVSNYEEALRLSEELNDENGISFVHTNLGVVYKSQGNYPLAIDYYNKGLDYSRKTGDTLSMALKLNNLGDVYTYISKYNQALEYHQRSLKLSILSEYKDLIASNNGNIGAIYMHQEEYAKALKYYGVALEISQEINDIKQTAVWFYNLGEVYLLLNKNLIARENFMKAEEISQEISHKYVLSASYVGIAKTYLNEKQYTRALSYTMKGKKIADELALINHQKTVSELLSTIYSKTGDYKKALESHQQFKLLNDSLFNEENVEKITQLEYEYKYKQELESANYRELKLTKTVNKTSQDLKESKRNFFLGIIVLLLVTIVLGGVIFFLKLRNVKSSAQNIAVEQKLLRSQMTPHFIFNSLSVLQGMILNKEDKKAVSYLSKFSKLLRIILENSRDKTVSLDQELSAVENYLTLQNIEEIQPYKYTVLVGDAIDESQFKIPPMLIQPFVENAIEHAFGTQKENRKIDIHLTYLDEKLVCTITDNGIGINAQKESRERHKKSLATTITSERLSVLSKDFKMEGTINIEDRQKYNTQGTIVTLIIPYKIHVS
jgi:tetratricopeptide (TPR) repeat protein